MGDEILPRFYSNAVNVSPTVHDLTVTFMQVDGTALPPEAVGPHEPSVKAVCQVVMSIPHAKALLPLISRVIAQYETQFGVVPAPGVPHD